MNYPSSSSSSGRKESRLFNFDNGNLAYSVQEESLPSSPSPGGFRGTRPEIVPITEQTENCFAAGDSSGTQSFLAKPLYPIIYRNPISEAEEHSPDRALRLGKEEFHQNGAKIQARGLPEERIEVESSSEEKDRLCEICGRLISEKSPWNSCQNTETSTAAVLPCGDIFHAECLEETTPWSRIRDPPCPICEKGFVFSRPLEEALKCARRRRRDVGTAIGLPPIAGEKEKYGSRLKDSLKKGCRLSSWQGFWGRNKRAVVRV